MRKRLDDGDFSFPKFSRLLKRYEFSFAIRNGSNIAGDLLVMLFNFSNRKNPRLGIIASKKFGGAIQRNRFKRLVRESFRLSQHSFPDNMDIIIKPRSKAVNASLTAVQEEMLRLVKKVKGRGKA